MSFDSTVISRVQKVGSIVPLESGIYAVWFLNIEGGNILYNSEYIDSELVVKSGVQDKIFYFLDVSLLFYLPLFPNSMLSNQDIERKQALASKQDRNSNNGDRSPPSLEDLKRKGMI